MLTDCFVRLIDKMGDDNAIVQAARISYGKGTKTVREDRGLIRYLMKHRHTTPFEQVTLKFHVRCPIDVARQWFRHRTWSYNEYSTRYSEAIDGMLKTDPNQWRIQSGSNKQGSSGYIENKIGMVLSVDEVNFQEEAKRIYKNRLGHGVAKEQARKDLPMCNLTEFYGTVNLHNLFHFLGLRMDSHAQYEIRVFADDIFKIIQSIVPLACEAFMDYRIKGMFLSAQEIEQISGGNSDLNKRESAELETKMRRLGL